MAMSTLGYTLSPHMIDAADHEVPQHRKRLFIVASLSKQPLVLNIEKHSHVPVGPHIDWNYPRWQRMQAKIITLLLALAVTAFPLPSVAKTLQGKAVHISDGDTLIVMDERHRKYRVRLANIDCPEKRQPWGNKAKRALAGLVGNRLVRVEWGKTDRYGRLIGTVYHDNQNINRMLVADGHCWVYTRYNRDERLPDLQRQAQTARKGLWRLSEYDRIPPWEWRRNNE